MKEIKKDSYYIEPDSQLKKEFIKKSSLDEQASSLDTGPLGDPNELEQISNWNKVIESQWHLPEQYVIKVGRKSVTSHFGDNIISEIPLSQTSAMTTMEVHNAVKQAVSSVKGHYEKLKNRMEVDDSWKIQSQDDTEMSSHREGESEDPKMYTFDQEKNDPPVQEELLTHKSLIEIVDETKLSKMMDPATIHRMESESAKRAAKDKKEPYMWQKEDNEVYGPGKKGYPFPDIGNYTPKGWERVNTHFVDSSGLGAENEPALTHDRFHSILKPGKGYAIISQGQFQVHVGEFKKRK